MSPQTQTPTDTASLAPGETRTYRGRTVEELIPQIQAELGHDAIVVRREKGLTGGVGGFFQRPFVEVEAKAGTPRVDRYDAEGAAPALPPALAAPPSAPELEAPALPPTLDDAFRELTPADLIEGAPEPASQAPARDAAPLARQSPAALEVAPDLVAMPDLDAVPHLGQALPLGSAPGLGGTPDFDTAPFAAALAEAEAAVGPAAALYEPLPQGNATAVAHHATPTPEPPATTPAAPPAQPTPAPSSSAPPRGRARMRIEESLLGAGMSAELVDELIETAATHVLPVMPARTSLARAVHRALAQRIPMSAALPTASATIALVGAGGSGKSACCAALLDAYRERGALPAACAAIAAGAAREDFVVALGPEVPQPLPLAAPELTRALRGARERGLLLLDLPSLSPADRGAIRAQAAMLGALKPDRIVLTLPATLGAKPAAQLLQALRPLGASALAITHADETDQLGVAVEAACRLGVAPEYLLDRGRGRAALTQIDPTYLADRLLP